MRQTTSRKLESIVPKEHKNTFSLYQEEEPNFSLSSSPKTGGAPADTAGAPAEPLAASPALTDAPPAPEEGKPMTKDESTWLVKKLVGILRYAGAMAIEVRGAVPDEAFEIVDKLQDELEAIAASLEPFLANKPEGEEEPAPEGEEEPVPEGEEVPAKEPAAEPKFKAKPAPVV